MKSENNQPYDYIVVGAGSAGGMLAYRLTEDPSIRVLLLEAGSEKMHWTIRMPAAARQNFSGGPRNWCFETEPEPYMNNRKLFQPRGKVIGGSSSLNGMVFVRGHRLDYDNWAHSGAKGWSYQDVLPYFKSMETYRSGASDFRGGTGPIGVEHLRDLHPIEQAFLTAAQQAGYPYLTDYNGEHQEGVSEFDVNIAAGNRSGTARLLKAVLARSNLRVQSNSHATQLIFADDRVTGIKYLHNNQRYSAYAEREVVLATGAFQSPQLLMLSGIGPTDELKKHGIKTRVDLPGVGSNLHDHLEVHVKHRCPPGMSQNRLLRKDKIALAGLKWLLCKSGPAATPASRVGGFLKTSDAIEYPNLQFHFWPYFLEGWSPPPAKDGYCFDVGPVRPLSRGWVKLRSQNPLDPPRIRLNGLASARDVEEFRQCIQIAREIAAMPAFDFCRGPEVSPGPEVVSDADIDAYVRDKANSAYHPCGTCKIGDDEHSVVDHRLRVYGIEGLRVADASVIPTIPNGNINAPTLMIGERAAAMLLESDAPPQNSDKDASPNFLTP